MSEDGRLLVLRSALAQRFAGVEFGPRTWRVRWPTGLIEVVREVIFPEDDA